MSELVGMKPTNVTIMGWKRKTGGCVHEYMECTEERCRLRAVKTRLMSGSSSGRASERGERMGGRERRPLDALSCRGARAACR